jgi:hypothetical protein
MRATSPNVTYFYHKNCFCSNVDIGGALGGKFAASGNLRKNLLNTEMLGVREKAQPVKRRTSLRAGKHDLVRRK